jgi:undecaprenyl-diphosphatase
LTVFQAIILGIVQGLTEFLPISSSGHLLIVPWLCGWQYVFDNPELSKTFDVALHLGTFFSVLTYFWRDIIKLSRGWLRTITERRIEHPEGKLAWLILISTIPAGVVGVLLEGFIVHQLGRPWMIALLIIVFGLVMFAVDRSAKLDRDLRGLTWRGSVVIGLAQALALAPGVSRSGITIVTGLLLRLDRESAARYSFLMSIPVIGGASLYKSLDVAVHGLPAASAAPFLAGIAAAAVSGFVAIWFLLAFLRRHNLNVFVVYRLALGAAMLFLMITAVRSAGGV